MNIINVTKPGFYADDGGIKPYQGGTFPGVLKLEASRLSGVSPCTIIFSAKLTTRNSYDEHQVLGTNGATNIGYSWDAGDPTSGVFNSFHGTNKNSIAGAFEFIHTYELPDGSGNKTFIVACRCRDAAGNEALSFIDVTVQAQDDFYTAANTHAISNTLSPGGWDALGATRNPPAGYVEHTSIADLFPLMNVDDCVNLRILLHRGDDFLSEGAIKILSGNNKFHFSWFGEEFSGVAVTSTGISFIAPTDADKTNGIGGTILDSNNGLAVLTVGSEIDASGTTNNNATFYVRSVTAAAVTVLWTGKMVATESAGATITLTEHTLRPQTGSFHIGNRESGSTTKIMTDSQLAANASTFGNNGFCNNVYLDGIRPQNIINPMSYSHFTFHRCDLNRRDLPEGGRITICTSGDYCWENPTILDPNSVPFPFGMYLSDCIVIGSTADIAANGEPLINIQAVAFASIAWCGLVGTTAWNAEEHTFRIQGWINLIAQECDLLGASAQGIKGRFIIRGAGANRVGDWSDRMRGDITSDAIDKWLYPASQYSVFQNCYDSAGYLGISQTASGIQASAVQELMLDSVWTNHVIDAASPDCPQSQQLKSDGGKWVTMTSVTGDFNTGIIEDNASEQLENGPENVIFNSIKSSQVDYLGPTYLDRAGGTAFTLPVPTAPR